jgi:hypothetical protein
VVLRAGDPSKGFFAELSASLEKKVSHQVAEGFRSIARRIASSKELVVAGLGMVPGAGAAKELAGAALGTIGAFAGNNRSISDLRDDLSSLTMSIGSLRMKFARSFGSLSLSQTCRMLFICSFSIGLLRSEPSSAQPTTWGPSGTKRLFRLLSIFHPFNGSIFNECLSMV